MTIGRRIDENTSLPFKVILPVVIAIASAAVWIQTTLYSIRSEIKTHATLEQLSNWRNQLAEQNKNIVVPYIPHQ